MVVGTVKAQVEGLEGVIDPESWLGVSSFDSPESTLNPALVEDCEVYDEPSTDDSVRPVGGRDWLLPQPVQRASPGARRGFRRPSATESDFAAGSRRDRIASNAGDEEAESRRRYRTMGLTPSKQLMVERWARDAALASVAAAEAREVPETPHLEEAEPIPDAARQPARRSHWTVKEERQRLWPEPKQDRARHTLSYHDGDIETMSHATSTRALSAVTQKPSFDTEVSTIRSSLVRSSDEENVHSHNRRFFNFSLRRRSKSSSRHSTRSFSEEPRKEVADRLGPLQEPERRQFKRITSSSVMNDELSATIELFNALGGGLHTSFSERSRAASAKVPRPQTRARPRNTNLESENAKSNPLLSKSWNDWGIFMRRGLAPLPETKRKLFLRLLNVVGCISVRVGRTEPPTISENLNTLTLDVENFSGNGSALLILAKELLYVKVEIITNHLNALCSGWTIAKRQSLQKLHCARVMPNHANAERFGKRWRDKDPVSEETSFADLAVVVKDAVEVPAGQNHDRRPPFMNRNAQPPVASEAAGSATEQGIDSPFVNNEQEDSQVLPSRPSHEIPNPMRVTFISVKSYLNSEDASSRSLNFAPHPLYQRGYSEYTMPSFPQIPSLPHIPSMPYNTSFTRSEFVPQPPYDGPRPSLVERTAGKYYSPQPVYFRWHITEVIGKGSFSQVRLATPLTDGPRWKKDHGLVAVKLVSKTASDLFTKGGLCREVACYVNLSKNSTMPNLLEVSEDASTIYLVIEHLPGGLLFDRIAYPEFYPRYDERDVAHLVQQLAHALRDAHAANITHRDVKAENILFTTKFDRRRSKRESKIILMDYGIAHIGTEDAQEVVGTPLYIAPEVLLRKNYNTQADMWSLGVIVHMMLVGYPPFDNNDPEELIRMIKYQKVCMDGSEWKAVSSVAKDFVCGLLVKDPKKRMSAREALKHPWLGLVEDDGWPRLEVAQVAIQGINARNSWHRRNKESSWQECEQEMQEKDLEIFKVRELEEDMLGFDSGSVRRQLTMYNSRRALKPVVRQPRQGVALPLPEAAERPPKTARPRHKEAGPQQEVPSVQREVPPPPGGQEAEEEAKDTVNKDCKGEEDRSEPSLESASTISIRAEDASAILAPRELVQQMRKCMVERRDADAGTDEARWSRKRRSRSVRSKKKLSDEKLKKRRSPSGFSPAGIYHRLHHRIPS